MPIRLNPGALFQKSVEAFTPDKVRFVRAHAAQFILPPRSPDLLGPPFKSLRALILSYRIRVHKIHVGEAVQHAEAQAQANAADLDARIARVWEDSRFTPTVSRALAAGFTLAATGAGLGAALGSSVPVVGTLIGAAAGFIAGVFVGCLPKAEWDMFGNWRDYLDQLGSDPTAVAVRYLHFRQFRHLSDAARAKDSRPVFPAWRLIDRPFGNVRGGLDNDVFVLYQALWERDSVPNDPALIPWALAMACCEASPQELLRDQWSYQRVVNDRVGSQWLRQAFLDNAARTAKELREQATSAGMADYVDTPLPDSVGELLLAWENASSVRQ